jgi:hypothetical protein
MKEISRHDALGLGSEELAPGWTFASRSGWETVTAQYGGNARLRDDDTELLEFAHDPEIAPPGILPCQSADQLHGLFGKGWTSWSAV